MAKIEPMSKTVDNWSKQTTVRITNEPPVLSPEEIRIVEQRIANWKRKNF